MGTCHNLNAVALQSSDSVGDGSKQGVEGCTGIRYADDRGSVRTRARDLEFFLAGMSSMKRSPFGRFTEKPRSTFRNDSNLLHATREPSGKFAFDS